MGEISDDMINGLCCSLCGTYFEEAHKYPVVCKYCWEELDEIERKIYQKATNKEIGEDK